VKEEEAIVHNKDTCKDERKKRDVTYNVEYMIMEAVDRYIRQEIEDNNA